MKQHSAPDFPRQNAQGSLTSHCRPRLVVAANRHDQGLTLALPALSQSNLGHGA